MKVLHDLITHNLKSQDALKKITDPLSRHFGIDIELFAKARLLSPREKEQMFQMDLVHIRGHDAFYKRTYGENCLPTPEAFPPFLK